MIQLNLLPDIKLQSLKTEYQKRIVTITAVAVSGFLLTITIFLLLWVKVGQAQHIKSLSDDIQKQTTELKKVNDLDRILTIQNQLNTLPKLHQDKKITSRLFGFLVKLTPNKATISDVTLDVSANTLSIKGNADSLATVNKFVDAIKFTEFTNGNPNKTKAFSNVVLTNFSLSNETQSSGANKKITYQIDFNFDAGLFENKLDDKNRQIEVELLVPNIISTRSEFGKPGAVFDEQPANNEKDNR